MPPGASRPPAPPSASPLLPTLLWVWLTLGFQSFGGGAATLYLIRRAMVEQRGWISEEEFTRNWSLCQIAPGINLIGLTILIGRRLGGAAGIVVCLVGLLLPSIAITIAATAAYAEIQRLPLVQNALRGVIPATAGLGLLMSVQMARPLLAASRREGRSSLTVSLALLAGAGLIAAAWHPPIVLLLCGGGAAAALFQWARSRREPLP